MFKFLLLLVLVCILVVLFRGLFALLRPGTRPDRLVRALSVRIGLSILLFAVLMFGAFAGWWHPHAL